jgi:hypothetical protein
MSIIESAQHEIDQLIHTVERDLNQRGVLLLTRAHSLLTAVKSARLNMALCERTTPRSFFNPKWDKQAQALQQAEERLVRIIRGVVIPADDHERPDAPNVAIASDDGGSTASLPSQAGSELPLGSNQ